MQNIRFFNNGRNSGKSQLAVNAVRFAINTHRTICFACNDDRKGYWKQEFNRLFPEASIEIVDIGLIITNK